MSSKGDKEEWNTAEEEFREDADMQEEEYDEEDVVELDDEELDAEEYDEEEAQYSGDEAQEFDEDQEYDDDEVERKHDDGDELALAEYDDEDSMEVTKGEEYVDEYYMKKQRDLSRQLEEDRQTSLFQKKICSVVLLVTILVTIMLQFVIPNRIAVDTSEFTVDGITPSITDNGKDEYEVSFKGLGEMLFTNNNAPFVRMVLTGFSLQARFLCDTAALPSAATPLCQSIENGTTVSPFVPMSTWHRGTVIKGNEGLRRYELRIPKAIASSTEIREVMEASCEQNQNFKVEFRAEAEILHEYSSGFSLPITDIPSQTFACVEPNQENGLFNWS